MKTIACVMMLLGTVLIALPTEAKSPEELQNEAECEIDTLTGIVSGGVAERVVGIPIGPSDDSDPLYPTKRACGILDGACAVTQEAGQSVEGSYLYLGVYARFSVDHTVNVVTTMHCEGIVKAATLGYGGVGIRGVASRLGVSGSSEDGNLGLGGDSEADRSEDSCIYIGQLERCRTEHAMKWQSTYVFGGQLLGLPSGIAQCAPLDITNSENHPKIYALEVLGVTPADTYSWNLEVCDMVPVTYGSAQA